MNEFYLVLSILFSIALGGIALIAVTVNHRSPNCLILIFTFLFGNIMPMIAEIYLFNLGWNHWWWLILVNNFAIIPTIGRFLAMLIFSTSLEIGTIISIFASITFLLLGIFV